MSQLAKDLNLPKEELDNARTVEDLKEVIRKAFSILDRLVQALHNDLKIREELILKKGNAQWKLKPTSTELEVEQKVSGNYVHKGGITS